MTISIAIYSRLDELCDERGMTVNKLCDIACVTQSTVFSFRDGRSKNPGIQTIHKLCSALDITLAEFFDSQLFDNLHTT